MASLEKGRRRRGKERGMALSYFFPSPPLFYTCHAGLEKPLRWLSLMMLLRWPETIDFSDRITNFIEHCHILWWLKRSSRAAEHHG